MIFDSYDLSPVLFGTGKCPRETWDYFTENELLPGAVRWHQYKFQFNLRGDDGAQTGALAVDSNLGWKGAEKYVATCPQIFDLWADPQERYDLFMSFVQYPPRKLQSDGYTGPITITGYERFENIKQQLKNFKIDINPGQ